MFNNSIAKQLLKDYPQLLDKCKKLEFEYDVTYDDTDYTAAKTILREEISKLLNKGFNEKFGIDIDFKEYVS